ncbi:hypothetical protein HK405_010107, partial [Cladochytrium tenue]
MAAPAVRGQRSSTPSTSAAGDEKAYIASTSAKLQKFFKTPAAFNQWKAGYSKYVDSVWGKLKARVKGAVSSVLSLFNRGSNKKTLSSGTARGSKFRATFLNREQDGFQSEEFHNMGTGVAPAAGPEIFEIDATKVPCHFIHKLLSSNMAPAAGTTDWYLGPLNYLNDKDVQKDNRADACPRHAHPTSTCNGWKLACDEFPFANSNEGGTGASTFCVPGPEFQREGGSLSQLKRIADNNHGGNGYVYYYKYTNSYPDWPTAIAACITNIRAKAGNALPANLALKDLITGDNTITTLAGLILNVP